ncbi:MAG: NHL repeat-containing protein [Treponema sp.]|nr:NHL repeat-containing protein [Treponema sp.]
MISKKSLPLLCFLLSVFILGSQTDVDFGPNYLQEGDSGASLSDTISAQNEFRIGVQAYYRYAFNEAINSFERANSFRPGEPLILDWLGRAYYRSGFEDTALRQWAFAADRSSSSSDEILLRSRVETVRNRRSLLLLMEEGQRYVEAGRYPGRIGTSIYFRQPVSVQPLNDGTAWVTAYTSNELIRIDVNGLIRWRVRGPINGFDRPYDVVRSPDGRLYISEYRGGRVSVLDSDGNWLSYVGSKGIGPGELMGPQNLAVDEDGYLYVVDYGNRRISKFGPEGNFLFFFGRKGGDFNGFLSPTGIACMDERVFVADGVQKQIHTFDRNGTYLGILVEEGLIGPESIRIVKNYNSGLSYGSDLNNSSALSSGSGQLLVADTSRILLIDPESSIVRELGMIGGNARIVGADTDNNGNILAANFRGDEVAVMNSAEDMASGFFVQIDRVVADKFPQVTVELSVQDRRRRPVLGLDQHNFLLTERNYPVQQQEYLGAAYLSSRYDISVLMERSDHSALFMDDLAAALRDITAAGPRVVSVVSAGEIPVKERVGAGAAALAAAARNGNYTPRWRFDTGLRLAATDLLAGEKKRAVVFVGSGTMGELAFEQYSLSELAAYLANNGIACYAVIVGDGQAGDELRYLCEETGGEIAGLYRPSGVGPVIQSIGVKGSGSYALSYRSSLQTNFGRNILPIEVEVYLMERSGRDRITYFAPLE